MQKNTSKQVEALKEETHKSLKEIEENTSKQVKQLNKTIQDLKMEVGSLKKTQSDTALEMENLGKRTGVKDGSITNRIQEIEERISVVEDTRHRHNNQGKYKKQKAPISKHSKNSGHNEKT
jgi:chromosome segregation ATPase